jgi:hypothetical protein
VLEGAVHAESADAATGDASVVDANRLALRFAAAPEDGEATARGGAAPIDGRRRTVTGFTAVGTAGTPARLEHRTPDPAAPDAPPRLFFVNGPRIDYDPRALEGTVEGAGSLLVRDLRPVDTPRGAAPAADPESAPAAALDRGGFSRRGDTVFTWTEGMQMTHIIDDRYRIEMHGSVEVVNRGVDGTHAWLTARSVEAVVRRTAAPTGDAPDGGIRPTNAIDAGGSLDVIRIVARGGVFVHTDDREVACDEFDYTLSTGIATVSAAPGRTVTIMTRDAPRPVTARRAIWNMDRDSLTVEGGGLP